MNRNWRWTSPLVALTVVLSLGSACGEKSDDDDDDDDDGGALARARSTTWVRR